MRVAIAAPEDRGRELSAHLDELDLECDVLLPSEQTEYSAPVYELVISTLPLDQRVSAGEQLIVITEALEEGALEKNYLEHVEAGEELIYRLITASQIRGLETEGHLKRVTRISTILARELGWAEEDIAALQWATPLHDIGKLAIPKEILLKEGDLTDDEWETIKAHPEVGGTILSEGSDDYRVFRMARDIAVQHHERWDGTGYPNGRQGEEISESARIVAVANTYDAVTHDRTYRDDFSLEEAEELITSESGEYFDPDIVNAFQARQFAIRQVQKTYGDREIAEWKTALSEK
ncbi:MAG: HD-GYP domain-containing protein [Bradymonadaceae bacterium]